MKQVTLILTLFGFAACARLDSLYLPPNQQSRPSVSVNSYSSAGAGGYSGAGVGGYSGGGHGGGHSQIPIVRLDNQNNGDGSYSYAYETGNGISAHEQGSQRGGESQSADGAFSFTSPEGEQFSITYVADENGFQPKGAHLPTPPPIPEEILKSIQQNLADEARGVSDDGQYRPEPEQGYGGGASRQQYSAPAQLYNAPSQQVSAPRQLYSAPRPQQLYSAPSRTVQAAARGGNGGYRY